MIVELLIVQVESKLAENELRKAVEGTPLGLTHHFGEGFAAESLASEHRKICGVMLRKIVSREHHSR